ncbi:MAG: hypothetical protein KatS3mg111_1746 [Pirellulaceae bacterium]|nr:MAG: hypothetical protein KatS3mg111_1746 [Pirellulaceae bacterium]
MSEAPITGAAEPWGGAWERRLGAAGSRAVRPWRPATKRLWMASLLVIGKLTIVAVASYDIFLTIKYVDSLPMMELNPIGRWLMRLDDGVEAELRQVAAFIAAKFLGTFLVIFILDLLWRWHAALASIAASGTALFQLGLLVFLTMVG